MSAVFSTRLNWDQQPNPLSELVERKRGARANILDLTESNPTLAGFAYPVEAIRFALADARALEYHPSPSGLSAARDAVVRYYADRGRFVSTHDLLLTASTSEAYAYLFKLLCDPGDEILTPRPSYPLFEFLAALESVTVRQYPLRYDGAWHIDFAALEAAILPRTRGIVVVNPNNPTGSFLAADEFDRLQSLAASRGLPILIDEVFFDYHFSGRPPVYPAAQTLTFRMSGLSKIAGLPQMKLGWIAVENPLRGGDVHRNLELIADTYLSVATPVQWALPRLLAASESIRAQILDRARANLSTLRSLSAGSACNVLNVEGGWYAILQVPNTRSEESWALSLLDQHDVLIQPGFFFDFESEAFLVASLITPPDVFVEGIRRIVGQVS